MLFYRAENSMVSLVNAVITNCQKTRVIVMMNINAGIINNQLRLMKASQALSAPSRDFKIKMLLKRHAGEVRHPGRRDYHQ